MTKKRILKEFNDIQSLPLSTEIIDNNIYHWYVSFMGPENTPYQNGIFFLDVKFPESYPMDPPIITFKTKIYHCNINSYGKISLNILNDEWTPILTIDSIVKFLKDLLKYPNFETPLVSEIANLYNNDIDLYNKTARIWTIKYAT